MALMIAINAVLCFGVIVVVVAPLVWAILTQQRDAQAITTQRRRRVRAAARSERRAARPRYRPVARPA